ncbi:MAG: hypothetical protein R3E92_19890 [Burkholderiaceae bacterium]
MNELDSSAHTAGHRLAAEHETVKYFNNEEFEAQRYDEPGALPQGGDQEPEHAEPPSLSAGQLIIAASLVAMLYRATQGVVDRRMTLGDLVMVNAFMIQLYIPLGFLGTLYREIKQSLTDLDKMFRLMEQDADRADPPDAPAACRRASDRAFRERLVRLRQRQGG